MAGLQFSARDIQSTSAGDVGGSHDAIFDPLDNSNFVGGSINKGASTTDLLIIGGVIFLISLIVKKVYGK